MKPYESPKMELIHLPARSIIIASEPGDSTLMSVMRSTNSAYEVGSPSTPVTGGANRSRFQ